MMPATTMNKKPEAIKGNSLGMTSWKTMRHLDSPVARAASTKSRPRRDIVWARSTLAEPAHEVIAMTIVTEIAPRLGRYPVNTISNGIPGMTRKTAVTM